MRYKAVLFDFFGTLTVAVRRGAAHARIAEALGCDPQEWVRVLDGSFRRRAVGGMGGPFEALRTLAEDAGGRPHDSQLHLAFAERIAAVRDDGPLRPEAVPVLRSLRAAGLRTAVVSDCWYELPAYFPRLPVADLLDATVFSYEVGHAKPQPAIYLTACQRLDVLPGECLFVGDGGSEELTGARAVGMTAVRLAAPDLVDHLTFNADTRWDGASIGSLPQVLSLAGVPESELALV